MKTSRTLTAFGVGAAGVAASLLFAPAAQAAGCLASPGSPFVPAVYAPVLLTEAIPGVPAVDEVSHTERRFIRTIVDQPFVAEIPAVTKLETSKWRKTAPAGEGWAVIDTKKVVDVAYRAEVLEVSHLEYKYQRTVIDRAAAPAVEEVSHVETQWDKKSHVHGWTPTGETRKVVTQAAVAAVPAVYTTVVVTPAVPAWSETTDPGQPYVAPTYATVVVTPAVPAVPAVPGVPAVPAKPAVYEIEYLWKKHGHHGGQTTWSVDSPGHGWEKAKPTQSRNGALISPAVPGTPAVPAVPAVPAKPAVTEQVLVSPGQPYIAPTVVHHAEIPAVTEQQLVTPAVAAVPEVSHLLYEHTRTVIDVKGKPAVTEISHIEYSRWRTTPPAGAGWTLHSQRKVVDVAYQPERPEVSHQEHRYQRTVVLKPAVPAVPQTSHDEVSPWLTGTPEGEGWEQFDERTVIDQEFVPAVPAVEATYIDELVSPAIPAVAPVVCVVDPADIPPVTYVSEVLSATPVKSEVLAAAPAASATTKSAVLAATGSSSALYAGGAVSLLALGGVLVMARRRMTSES